MLYSSLHASMSAIDISISSIESFYCVTVCDGMNEGIDCPTNFYKLILNINLLDNIHKVITNYYNLQETWKCVPQCNAEVHSEEAPLRLQLYEGTHPTLCDGPQRECWPPTSNDRWW